jgi:ParB/RepB/Spo0J family partition protein
MTAVAEETTTTAAPPSAVKEARRLRVIPLFELHDSPDNPRDEFDLAELQELADSITTLGLLDEIKVRPRQAGGYEIAAGHRRKAACLLAGLTEAPCIVRDMDDNTFREMLVLDNDHRVDVHPLAQARGYQTLVLKNGLTARGIADRVGRSTDYVHDRLTLLALIPEAQRLFRANRFGLKVAIVLSKQPADVQERAIMPDGDRWEDDAATGGLWQNERRRWQDEENDLGLKDRDVKYEGLKSVTPAELQRWCEDHAGVDLAQPNLEIVAPELADNLIGAAETGAKIIRITHAHVAERDTKHGLGNERVYGNTAWKRADGLAGSKDCEYAAVGVVHGGYRKGETFGVCVRRDKCTVHWAKEVKARKQREAAREKQRAKVQAKGGVEAVKKADERAAEKAAREEAAAAAFEARVDDATPAIEQECRRAIASMSLPKVIEWVITRSDLSIPWRGSKEATQLKKCTTERQVLEALIWHTAAGYGGDLEETCDDFGLNFKALVDKHAPPAPTDAPAKKGNPTKKGKKK